MIRAHMATFPARADLVEGVVTRLLEQVDRLFLVFNEYEAIPAWANHRKIEPVIPDDDTKDVGKFFFHAAPGDTVFLVDDDLAYPSDYVSETLRYADRVGGLEKCCLGHCGNALSPHTDRAGFAWTTFHMDRSLGRVRGAGLLGTGTVCCLGSSMPSFDWMRQFIGFCDLGFAIHQLEAQRLLWVLPKTAGWLRSILPDELNATSLYHSVHNPRSVEQMPLFQRLATEWPHQGKSFASFNREIASVPSEGEQSWSN